jgi:hypothetical protein
MNPLEEQELLQELKTTKDEVLYLLKRHRRSRSCDFFLQWQWLKIFQKINLPRLKSETFRRVSGKLETLARTRRKIQNEEGKFLPTVPEVLRKRKERSERMKKVIRHV